MLHKSISLAYLKRKKTKLKMHNPCSGCYCCLCLLLCYYCLVAKSCQTFLRLHGLEPASLLCPWDFSGKNARVGCQVFLWVIFLTQGSDHCSPCFSNWLTVVWKMLCLSGRKVKVTQSL